MGATVKLDHLSQKKKDELAYGRFEQIKRENTSSVTQRVP